MREEKNELKTSLGYITRSCLKTKTKQNKEREREKERLTRRCSLPAPPHPHTTQLEIIPMPFRVTSKFLPSAPGLASA
jgi:hypothetical protein